MNIIPAVDLKEGRCVRLLQGKKNRETRYADDPVRMAKHWEEQGAKRLHIVDLDGAFEDPSENKSIIRTILNELTIPCEVGGGLRSKQAVESVLKAGAEAVIIGTAGVKNPKLLEDMVREFGNDSIIAGVDCKKEHVMVKGWEENSELEYIEWIGRLNDMGVEQIIYTDIERDGMESGPDVGGLRKILNKTNVTVIASGGVGTLDHIRQLKKIESERIPGIIVGKALYEKNFTLEEARNIVDRSRTA